MKQLFKNAKAIITILILTLSLNGCENSDDNLPEIFAGFTHTTNEATGAVTFMNTSSEVRHYLWDFGDGTTSTEINPVKTYANGTYTVILTITNVAGASNTYQDIVTIGGAGGGNTCTAETVESLSAASLNMTFKSDPTSTITNDGANFQWVANPKSDAGINSSCYVGKIIKSATNPWDNNQINLDAKLDFNAHAGLKMKVYSSVPGFKVLLKLEDKANSGTYTELEVTTTKTNEWEELSFPFASTYTGKYDRIVLIFDLATKNNNTYYFDDLALYGTGTGTGGTGTCTAETVESLSAASLNITFKSDQTANVINDGTNFNWVSNPDANNTINSSCYVGKITKLANNPWDNTQIVLDSKLDFNASAGLKIKVYSAKAGFKVRVKLEDKANAATNTELEVTTTKTSAWEELTFPFASSQSGKFDKIVLFFDLNANNKDVYYFDDIKLYGTGSGTGGGTGGGTGTAAGLAQNSDFETGSLSGWIAFQNGGTSVLDNTTSNNGGSWSGKLETNGPSNPAFKQEAVGAGKVKSGDKITVKFDVKGSVVQPGAVFNVLLFGEGAAGASFTYVFSPAPSIAATWTTSTGTYTIPSNADVSKGLSFLIEAVCGGDAGCKVSVNIDNVSVIIN
jgi:hypothetical protein